MLVNFRALLLCVSIRGYMTMMLMVFWLAFFERAAAWGPPQTSNSPTNLDASPCRGLDGECAERSLSASALPLSSGLVEDDLCAPLCGHSDAPLASVSYLVPLKVSHEIFQFPDGCFKDRFFGRPRNECQTVHMSAVGEKTQLSGPGEGTAGVCCAPRGPGASE